MEGSRSSRPQRLSMTKWIIGCLGPQLLGCDGNWLSRRAGNGTLSFMSIRRWAQSILLLLPPPPFSEARQEEIVARVKQIPITLQAAQENLTDMRQPFVQLGIDGLDHVEERLEQMAKGLAPELNTANHRHSTRYCPPRLTALTVNYRAWLMTKLPPPAKKRLSDATTTFSSCARSRYSLHSGTIVGYEPAGVEPLGRV